MALHQRISYISTAMLNPSLKSRYM